MRTVISIIGILFSFAFYSCGTKEENLSVLFKKMEPHETGIDFRNDLTFDKSFNIFTYRNFYNGGGVAIGDINNDGLADIYFTSNQGENKLYLNKGNFKFIDVTAQAGVSGKRAWSTGVAMADVNGDGLLDIYVCNSGDIKGDNKQNELFINNGDLTFTERAEEYGLADQGFSTHAVFFDYDRDGDLDVYLLNNSYQAIGSFNLMQNVRHIRDSVGGDKLYRNDGNRFTDVSERAGIYGSVIGFGLGVTIGDVNNDGWMDIFISNDFFERDYLYINRQDGTFKEILESAMPSISAASMGADMADINNDGWLDIFVTDMLPEDDFRLKQITTFENWDKFTYNFANGYHYQLTRNMLHLNNGNETFSEIGRLAGVESTDWSWGALIFDMDNDGRKDIFVANGIYKDITDLDYLSFIADGNTVKRIVSKEGVDYKALIDPIPVNPVANYAFKNKGNLQFENYAKTWGFSDLVHSNGAAYGDLDNDGALDLVINNVNENALVYRNNSSAVKVNNRYLKVELFGLEHNRYAIGARIEIKAGTDNYFVEQMPNRGFQSSVDPKLNLGVGQHQKVDEIKVTWPDGKVTLLTDVETNRTVSLYQQEANTSFSSLTIEKKMHPLLMDVTEESSLTFQHKENSFVDFDRDRLTYHMLSTQGPRMAIGDVNNDGIDDVYLGGAKGQVGELFVQDKVGNFVSIKSKAFEEDAKSEDISALFLDIDNDGDLDLYVASGGNEFSFGAPELIDRIYINDGKGNFSRSNQPALNINAHITGTVKAADYDGDGMIDIFTGIRLNAFNYGVPANGIIYRNDGHGNFIDVTAIVASDLKSLGHISDAVWTDVDNDGDLDLLVVGEWMFPELFENKNGIFKRSTVTGLDAYKGWWNVIIEADLNNDGKMDYLLGNHGLNSRFKATAEQPVVLYTNDFDNNGTIDHVFTRYVNNRILPYTLKHELVAQMPLLKKKYLKYESYNKQALSDIFTVSQIQSSYISTATYMSSAILSNEGNGKLVLHELPVEAQFSPVFGILVDDLDGDGMVDIMLGGNFFEAKPEAGRYDASYGLVLKGLGDFKFKALPASNSGFFVKGAIRDIKMISIAGEKNFLVVKNNDFLQVFKRATERK